MKIYMVALLMMAPIINSSEPPPRKLEPPCFYNPYSLQKITSLNIINYFAQLATTSQFKAQLMNRHKTSPDILHTITKVIIEHTMPDEIIKKMEFYFSRLAVGSTKEIIQRKILWQGTVARMSNALNNNFSFPANEQEIYDDIASQTVYEQELKGQECIIPGKKRIYVFRLLNNKPKLVDATTIMDQDEVNRAVTACALYTYDDIQTKIKRRTVIFGTDDGKIWIHRTGPTEMLCAPLGYIITKIVYNINAAKNEINKIGLIAKDDQERSYAYMAIEDDHPQERGEWFKGSTLWQLPVSNIISLIFKNGHLFAYTPTSWSVWTIEREKSDDCLSQIIPLIFEERYLTGEEDNYRIPRAGTPAVESKKIDRKPVPAFGVPTG